MFGPNIFCEGTKTARSKFKIKQANGNIILKYEVILVLVPAAGSWITSLIQENNLTW